MNGALMPEIDTWKITKSVELATLKKVDWFNNHRLMGNRSAITLKLSQILSAT